MNAASKSDTNEMPSIGIIGQPNVGKSSLVNALVGKKVVSVSKQCGHTKHFQHQILKNKDGNQVATLIDSPGLIFPIAYDENIENGNLSTPRAIYEISGLYPIPQIRETYTAVRFIAEHIPLDTVYNLKLDPDDYGPVWTPYSILGTLADKKGYSIEGGGPDFHRAGLEILRDCVDGYVLITFNPPEKNTSTEDYL